MAIEPDTKDWTWVLEERCAECGFDPAAVDLTALPDLIRQKVRAWDGVLDHPDAAVRPAPNIWSPLEYACHVRDVHLLFGERARLMLEVDEPTFPNWDQDATAVEQNYGGQDPRVVAEDMVAAAEDTAAVFAGVPADQWERVGRRSNGSVFTVATLGVYYLHDVVHHLRDVGR